MHNKNVRRFISYFNKTNEKHVGDIDLIYVDLSTIQVLFNQNIENPMYDSYPITPKEAVFFTELARISFDFEKYDYFLEAQKL